MKGLTLIETLIYAAIVSGFVVLGLVITYQMIDFQDDLNGAKELYENQRFLTQKINWVLSGLSVINNPAVGAVGASISASKIGFSPNPLVIDSLGGTARLSIGGGAAVALTNNFVTVSDLSFENINFSGKNFVRAKATLFNGRSSTTIDSLILIR